MAISEILNEIDREIALLQQVRALLDGTPTEPAKTATAKGATGKKRTLSPEGRRRIAEAVRQRWARQRKATSG